ncbi:MAG: cation:proton antiporter [Planctomycetota bacterium]|nr:cation:proton antiporter [Planctomycetota bacterium]
MLAVLAQQGVSHAGVQLLLVVATAGAVALALGRLRLPTVPGYLIAGAIIGPHTLALVQDSDELASIGSLSTILLMFVIGLQLDMTRVRTGLLSIVGVTLLATGTMAALAWPLASAWVGSAPAGLALALAFSVAATAVPLRMLETRHETHSAFGRLAFGVTLFQDLIAVGMLAVLPLLAMWKGEGAISGTTGGLALRGMVAVGGMVVLIFGGRWLLPRLLDQASRVGSEVLIVVCAGVALGAAILSAVLGLSPEMGAFIAGFLLASTPFRFHVASALLPLRDLFLAVFFTVVGMSVPFMEVLSGWWIVLLGLLALGVFKLVGIAGAAWALGAPARHGVLAAITLAPAGEFTLVVLGQSKGILDAQHVAYATAIVGLSLVAAPLIVWAGHRSTWPNRIPPAPWVKSSALRAAFAATTPDAPLASGEASPPHVIVAGFGPVGRAVADALEQRGVRITIIELNPRTIARQATLGRQVVYGDVSSRGVLESAGIAHAQAVVLSAPDEDAMLRACESIRSFRDDVFVSIRVSALSVGLRARALGADHMVVEELVTAETMAREVAGELDRRAGARPAPSDIVPA